MISLHTTLLPWIHENLPVPTMKDPGLNGLQIEYSDRVQTIGLAVSANARTIAAAKKANVDTLIVHHGLFWGGQMSPLSGLLGERVRLCYQSEINLIGLHLPLDVHPSLGNNAQIGAQLGWACKKSDVHGLVYESSIVGSLQHIAEQCSLLFKRPVTIAHENFAANRDPLRPFYIGWCSGAGGDFFNSRPFDIFITGEFSEHHYDSAYEARCILIEAGHYATERLGILALKKAMEMAFSQTNVKFLFLEEWSPW